MLLNGKRLELKSMNQDIKRLEMFQCHWIISSLFVCEFFNEGLFEKWQVRIDDIVFWHTVKGIV